jgi:flagellar hook-basal body complex protein FliE
MSTPGAPIVSLINGVPGINSNGVIPDLPDLPDASGGAGFNQSGKAAGSGVVDFTGLVNAVQSTSPALEKAQKADSNFASGKGNLMEMMLQRRIADTYLQIDEAFSSKAVQAITTLMNMQV